VKQRKKPRVHKFATEREISAFARLFIRQRAQDFKKNVDICLTARRTLRRKADHAYMPGLMTCFAFLDMLSGLYAGNIRSAGLEDFLKFAKRFLPHYQEYHLRILYVEFRNKLAHLAHPYFVLDTDKEPVRIGGPRRLITWTIYASRRNPPVELVSCGKTKVMSQNTPWDVYYDHRIHISVRSLARDARKAARGPGGYVSALCCSPDLQAKFKRCMYLFYAL
jgi:hypothetical protein